MKTSNGWMTGPGWPTHVVSASLLLWTSWETSGPGSLAVLSIVFCWLCLMSVWLVRAVLRVWMGWRHRLRGGSPQWLRWAVEPLFFLSAAALIYSGALLHLRFNMSRPAMDELARLALAKSDDAPLPGGRAGLYWVDKVRCFRVDPAKPVVIVYLAGGNGGFEFNPDEHDAFMMNLGAGWYGWVHSLN